MEDTCTETGGAGEREGGREGQGLHVTGVAHESNLGHVYRCLYSSEEL